MILIILFMTCCVLNADASSCLKKDDLECESKPKKSITLQRPIPILLWWYDDVFPHSKDDRKTHRIKCPNGRTCFTSCDQSLKNDPTTSAYIFYGTEFSANNLPLPRNPNHIWALFHEESPMNNWIFSHEDGISIFNYTATFSRDSNYPLTTQYIVDFNDWVTSKFFVSTKEKNRHRKAGGLASVVFLQRDCDPPSDRDRYVKELMKFIDVDSYGPCVNNRKMPKSIDGFHKLNDDEYFHFLARYKFHISFENAICKDYMTEKLFRPLQIGVVPVYMGSSHAKQFMPNNHSAIFVADFDSPKELAKYLIELDNDDSKYNEYLRHHNNGIENDWLVKTIDERKWRYNGPQDKVNFIHRMFAGFECDLCGFVSDRIDERDQRQSDKSNFEADDASRPKGIMGCPEPMASIADLRSHVNKSHCFWDGLYEAKAFRNMLLNNEEDSTNFESKYLKRRTCNYP